MPASSATAATLVSAPGDNDVFWILEGTYAFTSMEERIARSGDVVAIPNGGVYALKNVGESSGRMFVFNVPGRIHAAFFSSLGEPMPVGTSEFRPPSDSPPDIPRSSKGQTLGRHNPSLKFQSRMWEDQSASRAKTSSGPLKVLVANSRAFSRLHAKVAVPFRIADIFRLPGQPVADLLGGKIRLGRYGNEIQSTAGALVQTLNSGGKGLGQIRCRWF